MHKLDRREALIALAAVCTGCGRSFSFDSAKSKHAASTPFFRETAQTAGLNYVWSIPGLRPLDILQTIGNGCAFLDFNGDGFLDILLVGTHPALYAGDGKGNFRDVTNETGLNMVQGHFLGCAVGDYNNDGFPDIYLTSYQGGALLRNVQGRRFEEVTRAAGIPAQPWGTSAAWVQTTDSGLLDLYICNYAHYIEGKSMRLCSDHGHMSSCGPRNYTPVSGRLYQNMGDGRFEDVTLQRHANGMGRGLGIACADYDRSGFPTLAIANDEIEGDMLHPQGSGYVNIARKAGTASDAMGNIHGGMGTDWGDYDNDGLLDLLVATFQNEVKSLYHNNGDGTFTDKSLAAGLAPLANPYVTFGAKFIDTDNNGWLDIVLANGHVQDNIHLIDAKAHYHQHMLLLYNGGGSMVYYRDVSHQCGQGFMKPIIGRGLAIGDYDNDGKMDILAVDSEGKPLLFHNETEDAGSWLLCKLQGRKANRDGYGAMLRLTAGGRTLLRHCHADGSYMSSSDSRVHFGLGKAVSADMLEVQWPGGHIDKWTNLPVNRQLLLVEGKPPV